MQTGVRVNSGHHGYCVKESFIINDFSEHSSKRYLHFARSFILMNEIIISCIVM